MKAASQAVKIESFPALLSLRFKFAGFAKRGHGLFGALREVVTPWLAKS
jgi:hypothetical protein